MAKYIPVGEPSNESERRGIRELRDHLPDHYVVIGNFDLAMPRRKNTLEFDAVVVGEWGLHAVEIKGWTGEIRGDQRVWELEWGRVQNPFRLNEKKAKALRDLLVQHLDYLPGDVFCQSVVFLPLDGVDYDVDDGNSERLLTAGQVHEFFVDEDRVYELGPGPMLDEELRQKVVDTIVPLADPAPGLPRIESYEIQEELDRRGAPYREFVGKHKFLKQRDKVRIKRYEVDPLLSEGQRETELNKIFRDMEALESLGDNKYVARAYEMVLDREDEQIFYLVSEWVGPRTLREFIDENDEPLQPKTQAYRTACDYSLHLLRAIDFMHARTIIHRNLHPRVIYLADTNESVPLKIADFDYARVADLQSIAGDVDEIGTEGYTAPELWSEEEYDAAVDIFSVGAILFEIFSATRLFTSIDEMLDVESVWERKRVGLVDDELRSISDGLVSLKPRVRGQAFDRAIAYFEAQLAD